VCAHLQRMSINQKEPDVKSRVFIYTRSKLHFFIKFNIFYLHIVIQCVTFVPSKQIIMKALTKKQVSNLNNLINNGKYITTSVAEIAKNKYSYIVTVLVHTMTTSEKMIVVLNEKKQFISINGSHILPSHLKGNVSIN